MIGARLWYVNVFVTNLPRAVSFYRDALELEPRTCDETFGYASFQAGDLHIGVAQVDADSEEAPALVGRHTGVGLGVPDLMEAHKKLVERGVDFPSPPRRQPWGGFMALLADPDGNVFYLDELREE